MVRQTKREKLQQLMDAMTPKMAFRLGQSAEFNQSA